MQYLEVFTVDFCGGKRRTVQLCIPDVPNLAGADGGHDRADGGPRHQHYFAPAIIMTMGASQAEAVHVLRIIHIVSD